MEDKSLEDKILEDKSLKGDNLKDKSLKGDNLKDKSLKIKFLGATKCVTGSCHLLSVDDMRILLDCGLFQSHDGDDFDNEVLNFNPEDIDFVILSHSHVDHSGRIPLLYKRGFRGKVICTKPTVDLCEYLLKDAAKILGEETYFENLDRREKKLEPLHPLYELKDVEEALNHFNGYDYDEIINLSNKIKVVFRDAGHILGSAICEIIINSVNEKNIKVVFSGDIGNKNKDILNDPHTGLEADYLIMESTYGDKVHEDKEVYPEFLNIAKQTVDRGGNLIIPCFSLGRTQEVIYMLNSFVEGGKLSNCSVYIDSPLAASLTEIFKKHEEYFDRAAKRLIENGDDPLSFKGLHFVKTNEDSEKVQKVTAGAIIIVAGGLHEGGRVSNHLKNNLSREECGIIITSYQGRKSIGGRLIRGEKQLKIAGEEVQVKANIHYIGGLSCHADKDGLFQWVSKMVKKPKNIFLVHGDEENTEAFNKKLVQNGYRATTVEYLQEFNLNNN